ncbi:MAG: DUF6152 family protein [Bauldia sp.]
MKTAKYIGVGAVALAAAALMVAPASSHHSFAMYDDAQTLVFTGVVVTVIPDANHLRIEFAVLNEERNALVAGENGQPLIWNVEMGGASAMANEGITVNGMPRGTIFSVGLNPLRSGLPAGSRVGGLFSCPANTPPAPGAHCDSVAGNVEHGDDGPLATPTGPA